jgi:hypothetical protein
MSGVNVTGRISSKRSPKDKKVWGPPKGGGWTWQTTELQLSPAWRSRSINTVRLIDFLQIEHRSHAGLENGALKATYDQLTEYGLTRSEIKSAIYEAEFLGLLEVTYEGGRFAGNNQPSTYRLTFYADKNRTAATNEWKGVTETEIKLWRRDQANNKKMLKELRKKQNSSVTFRTTVVQLSELPTFNWN